MDTLVLTAARVDAAEALRIGLANRVVAPDELESAAAERRPPRHQGG